MKSLVRSAVGIVCMCAALASANLVANPGFEDVVLSDGTYDYSGESSYTDQYGTAYIVNPKSGGWAYVFPNSGDNVLVACDTTHVYQVVSAPMVPGVTYALSAYVHNLSSVETAYYSLALKNTRTGGYVATITSDPTYSANATSSWSITTGPGAGSNWAQVTTPTYTATAADAGYSLQVSLWSWQTNTQYHAGQTSYVAWDDITLVPEPATFAMIVAGAVAAIRRRAA